MANRFERQVHESAQKGERNDGPAAGRYKSIILHRKRTHLLCYLLGMGSPLKSLKLAIMGLKVKKLQKADITAYCLHDEFNNEKQLMKGKPRPYETVRRVRPGPDQNLPYSIEIE